MVRRACNGQIRGPEGSSTRGNQPPIVAEPWYEGGAQHEIYARVKGSCTMVSGNKVSQDPGLSLLSTAERTTVVTER